MNDTRNWQISIDDPATIVEGIEDIAQCIYLILVTALGSDPLRPEFGSEIYKYIDRPMNVAHPLMISEAVRAIRRWEKRIAITKCWLVSSGVGSVVFHVTGVVDGSKVTVKVKM
jgi:phage baseplate assembly protein W